MIKYKTKNIYEKQKRTVWRWLRAEISHDGPFHEDNFEDRLIEQQMYVCSSTVREPNVRDELMNPCL